MLQAPHGPDLPQELYEVIIDYLYDDKASLASCSLVSKAWIPTARLHLFRTIRHTLAFDAAAAGKLIQDMTRFLQEAPSIALLVRDLYLQAAIPASRSCVEEEDVSSLLKLLPQLQSLTMKHVLLTDRRKRREIETRLRAQAEDLSFVHPTSHYVFDVLSTLSNLRCLVLYVTSGCPTEALAFISGSFARLESLDFCELLVRSRALIRFLEVTAESQGKSTDEDALPSSRLKYLGLRIWGNERTDTATAMEYIRVFGSLLQSVGGSLQHLTINMLGDNRFIKAFPESTPFLNLSCCRNLATLELTIPWPSPTWSPSWDVAYALVASVSSERCPAMIKFSLSPFAMGGDVDAIALGRLDGLFADRDMPRLQHVVFVISPWPDSNVDPDTTNFFHRQLDKIAPHLPFLNGKGMLRIER